MTRKSKVSVNTHPRSGRINIVSLGSVGKSGLLTAGLVTACGGVWSSDSSRAATATASMAVSATVVRTCVVSLQPYPTRAGVAVDCPADVPYLVSHGSGFVSETTGAVQDAANSNQSGSGASAAPGLPAAITTITY